MNFWRIKFFPCVLVLIVLMLMGCSEKVKQPEDSGVKSLETQRDYVEGAISTIMTKMKWKGDIAGKVRTRRSLAVHILGKDTTLMAYFMSQQWDKLPTEKIDGQELYTFDTDGNRMLSTDAPNVFWKDRYTDIECASDDTMIELEANVKEVWLEDVETPTLGLDCRARVDYEFRVVCRDENGMIISSRRVAVRSWLCHRNPCPWYEECPLFDKAP